MRRKRQRCSNLRELKKVKGGRRGKAGGEVYELVVVEGVKTIESKVRHNVGQLVEKTLSLSP